MSVYKKVVEDFYGKGLCIVKSSKLMRRRVKALHSERQRRETLLFLIDFVSYFCGHKLTLMSVGISVY